MRSAVVSSSFSPYYAFIVGRIMRFRCSSVCSVVCYV